MITRKINRNIIIKLCTIIIVVPFLCVSFNTILKASPKSRPIKSKTDFFRPVIKKLLLSGCDSSFIAKIINSTNVQFNEKYVKINVTNHLKMPDYSHNFSDSSVKKSIQFLEVNIDALSQCEEKFSIPKEIITAILWVETKCGQYLGSHNVLSVYLSTAMASQPEYIKMNKKELKHKFRGSKKELKQLEKKISERAVRKSNWAINELISLEKIQKVLPQSIFDIRGSWAGAFGISQFLPSSYSKWAVDGNNDGKINLFEKEDAIYSVANYLKINGWGDSDDAKRKALFHYNNSQAYVESIIKLASEIKEKSSIKQSINTPLYKQIDLKNN